MVFFNSFAILPPMVNNNWIQCWAIIIAASTSLSHVFRIIRILSVFSCFSVIARARYSVGGTTRNCFSIQGESTRHSAYCSADFTDNWSYPPIGDSRISSTWGDSHDKNDINSTSCTQPCWAFSMHQWWYQQQVLPDVVNTAMLNS